MAEVCQLPACYSQMAEGKLQRQSMKCKTLLILGVVTSYQLQRL